MALDTFIAGRYSSTFNSVDTGITDQGMELTLDSELEDIGESDAYGLTVIDGIYRGGNCFLQFNSLAYKAGSLGAFWPYGGAINGAGVLGIIYDPNQIGNLLPIGQLASNIAKAHVLTSTTGTPAASSPATLTGPKALLAKNFNGKLLFNSKLRTVPVRLRYYPYQDGTSILRFLATT